ncbi:MAG: trypsin-like peptidase domain-containing protein [Planctomycetes bacterium]|nr:trypsin-like peptidase domain-containing protein [Planctomycetota bacterium]
MIAPEVIKNVRNGVCAVGYLTVPLTEYQRNIQSPYFQVVGTGFLVRKTTVLTNRHVIQGLIDEQANLGFPNSQFFLSFVVPDEENKLHVIIRMIRNFAAPSNETLDVGFIEFEIVHETHFQHISPLDISVSSKLRVTEEVAICGYPYGTAMLKKNAKVYRWGPVIQSGFISAISPFDTTDTPDEILLDVRTAGGMSGAPIFRPSSGEVIGIHHSGWEATTALGLPLTQDKLSTWLEQYEKSQKTTEGNHSYD